MCSTCLSVDMLVSEYPFDIVKLFLLVGGSSEETSHPIGLGWGEGKCK